MHINKNTDCFPLCSFVYINVIRTHRQFVLKTCAWAPLSLCFALVHCWTLIHGCTPLHECWGAEQKHHAILQLCCNAIKCLLLSAGLFVTTVPLWLCGFPVFWHIMNCEPFATLCKFAALQLMHQQFTQLRQQVPFTMAASWLKISWLLSSLQSENLV